MDFAILAPEYSHNSAGNRIVHKLCHLLNKNHHSAYMLTNDGCKTNPNWLEPELKKVTRKMVAIYPEIVKGNPLRCSYVARWVLNNPGVLGGDTSYTKGEFVFVHSKQYLKGASKAAGRELGEESIFTLMDVEDFFFDAGLAREGSCFYIGKGGEERKKAKFHDEEQLTQIAHHWPETRKELASLLQKTETLYSYDSNTALLLEAQLCGCKTLIMKDGEIKEPKLDVDVKDLLGQNDLVKRLAWKIKAHFNL